MPTYARLRTDAIVFNPIPAGQAPANNSIFANSDTSGVTVKDGAGAPAEVTSGASAFLKPMVSGQANPIPVGAPVSKLANGKIVEADTDDPNGQAVVGIAVEAFSAIDEVKLVHLLGPNVSGVLTSLGFVPGEEIYLGEAGGYTNNPGTFVGDNDSIIKIGVADCGPTVASATATDLIIFPEVIARP